MKYFRASDFQSNLEEGLALKNRLKPSEKHPRFQWSSILERQGAHLLPQQAPHSSFSGFSLGDVAEIIGSALTDLLYARENQDIFNEDNRRFVKSVTQAVGERLAKKFHQKGEPVSAEQLHLIIEETLIEHEAFDVAHSLVAKRSFETEVKTELRTQLIRRNDQVVPWDPNKVEVAVRKAFLSKREDSSPAVDIAARVTRRVKETNEAFVDIETVQDMAQEELMRAGYFKVAESYIVYRQGRRALRQSQAEKHNEDVRQDSMIVLKSEEKDGPSTLWNPLELRRRIEFASIGLDLSLNVEAIEQELRRSLYAEMTPTQLRHTIILNAKSLIEKDADFAFFAGRILVSYIYEEVLDWDLLHGGVASLRELHREAFRSYLKRGVDIKRLDPKLLNYDLKPLAEAIDPLADLEFDYLGISTLYDRYLIVNKKNRGSKRLETPQFFWMRVAMGLFIQEQEEPEKKIIQLYNLYKSRRFCSSTPTLFNSGTLRNQLSSCYLYKVDDSLESIMQRGISENAYLSKWAGGLGGSWTAVRGTGSHIEGTNGESQGVIPFLKLHSDQLVAVNQGGKRRGSGCAYLETWHNDILDFIELRRNTGDERRRAHDMNIANWIPDLFMKRMENRENWTLFRSNEVPDLHESYGRDFERRYILHEQSAAEGKIWSHTLRAIDLWKSMLRMLFETGHPWITFKDPCNIRSPQDHAGVVHSSNLCTEITLNTGKDETAVCNLGSIVLDQHLDPFGELDLKKLKNTINVATRALDNVIDINYYPTAPAENSNLKHRPIGLGVMGLQNTLFKKRLPFASEEALAFNDYFMEAIAYFAYNASSDLAKERGAYPSYAGSKWSRGLLPLDTLKMMEDERGMPIEVPRDSHFDWDILREKIKQQAMRHSNVLAIAPTATISNIMGTSPCVEPSYKNFFVKSNLGGDFVVLNQSLIKDLKARKLWDDTLLEQLKYFDGELEHIPHIPDDLKRQYATAFNIEPKWLITAAARRQKWIDQSQSINLFVAKPNLKTLSHMYRTAWHEGLKTTYYLRSMGASNIEKATVEVQKELKGPMQPSKTNTTEPNCPTHPPTHGETCEACQ